MASVDLCGHGRLPVAMNLKVLCCPCQGPGTLEAEDEQQYPWVSLQVPPDVWAAGEQELLLLLEPEEFLKGVFQLTQVLGAGLGSQAGCAVLPGLIKDRGAERACSGLGLLSVQQPRCE